MVNLSFVGNEMQLPAPVAHDPISHWHVVTISQAGGDSVFKSL